MRSFISARPLRLTAELGLLWKVMEAASEGKANPFCPLEEQNVEKCRKVKRLEESETQRAMLSGEDDGELETVARSVTLCPGGREVCWLSPLPSDFSERESKPPGRLWPANQEEGGPEPVLGAKLFANLPLPNLSLALS